MSCLLCQCSKQARAEIQKTLKTNVQRIEKRPTDLKIESVDRRLRATLEWSFFNPLGLKEGLFKYPLR